MRRGRVVVGLIAAVGLAYVAWSVWDRHEQERLREVTRSRCRRWADELAAQTTESGVYVRWRGPDLPEVDAWGRGLKVHYRQGGLAESLTVRSPGPDGELYTDDDIVVTRTVVNFQGVGHGIKQNIEDVGERGARGVVRGIGQGIREQVQRGAGAKSRPQDGRGGP